MRGFPLSPSDFALAMQQVEVDAEAAAIAAKVDAGFEFAALMDVGGEVFYGGDWRTITDIGIRNFGDLRLMKLDDGCEIKADRLAMRRYRVAVKP